MRKLVALLVLCLLASGAGAQESDPTVYRFAFFGCNRVGFTELSKDNPSSANRAQLDASFRELVNFSPRPRYVFGVGDLVNGYTHGMGLRRQLKAWKSLVKKSALNRSGITLVPIVGNHEVLLSIFRQKTKTWKDYPSPEALAVWIDEMRPYHHWKDGPTQANGNPDQLTSDQSRVSFTVTDGNVLYICVNTDTFIDNTTIGDVPLVWLEKKLAAAQADESIQHIFVLGHKTIERPDLAGEIIRKEERELMSQMLAKSSKVRAYLTAHYHLWNFRHLKTGVPQVIAGNAGTAPSGQFNVDGQGYFGYTVVDILKSGKVVVESWGRPIPEPYDSMETPPPSTLRERVLLPSRLAPES